MRILVAGDYVPHHRAAVGNNHEWKDSLLNIKPFFDSADYSFVNLEAPIADEFDSRIEKDGPALRTTMDAVMPLKELGCKCVTLANNHFRDYGDIGINKTISALDSIGLDHIGGGRDLLDAQKTKILKYGNETLAIINICENEFSVATENRGGSAPLDVVEIVHRISIAKKQASFVLVIIHGGHEGYQLPSPRMKKLYRFFIEMGADTVVNHHQHCFSGYEFFQGKPIFYGIGNFFFDWNGKRNDIWNYGFMVILNTKDLTNPELVPYIQCNETVGVTVLEDRSRFTNSINELNSSILDDQLLKAKFLQFALTKKHEVLKVYSPFYSFKFLDSLVERKIIPYGIKKTNLLCLLNHLQCESHNDLTREIMINGLSKE